MFNEDGTIQEGFNEQLPEILGDSYYNDPDTKQQPTKVFDNIKDKNTLVKNYVESQRTISKHGQEMEAKIKEATEGTIKIPGENADEATIAAYREATGAGKTVDDYKLTIPEEGNFGSTAELVKELALVEGAPKALVSKIWDGVVAGMVKQQADLESQGNAIMAKEEADLKAEIGEGYNQFITDGTNALAKFKNGAEIAKTLETMGMTNMPVVSKFLNEVSKLVLEGGTDLGGPGGQGGDGWPIDYSKTVQS